MTIQFPELAKLLGNDPDKVRLVIGEFYRSATLDLQRLERAAAADRWDVVHEIAQRLHVGCLQICEPAAAHAATLLGHVPGEFFADVYARRRPDIVELLERAQEFTDGDASAS